MGTSVSPLGQVLRSSEFLPAGWRAPAAAAAAALLLRGRGLHSSTIRRNISTFCGIRWVHDFPPVY